MRAPITRWMLEEAAFSVDAAIRLRRFGSGTAHAKAWRGALARAVFFLKGAVYFERRFPG